ncbi:MAG: GGDEF domain-containing protein [Wenzhouxiangella sp.]
MHSREDPDPGNRLLSASGADRPSIELSVMTLIGGVAVVVIGMFSLYRLAAGELAQGMVNLVITLMLLTVLVIARTPRLRPHALILFGLAITAASLMSTLLVSPNGLLWTYLVISINFLILPHRAAILLNLGLIVILSSQGDLFDSLLHRVSWITVAVLLSALGLLFTRQLRQQRRMLERLATEDPLTGVGNRRLMQNHLEAAVAEFRRRNRISTLMVIDLDHFKQVNDNHGHEAGDAALEEFAAKVQAALRAEDGLYRMGGEEFVVLLRDMDEATARTKLPELHRRLSGQISGSEGPLYFSAGAAVLQRDEDWSSWLARADTALFEAKKSGRNRLVIAENR